MLKARLELRPINRSLVSGRASHYASYIELFAPLFPDAGELISLGDVYTVSLGAHATHLTLLMDRAGTAPLTVEKSLTISALLAYVTDSPVAPKSPQGVSRPPKSSTKLALRLPGTSIKSLGDYFTLVTQAAEMSDSFLDVELSGCAQREFPIGAWDDDKWVYIAIPSDAQVWRALSAYWSGMFSVLAPGRLLNFWRAIEAVTSQAQRRQLFADLHLLRARPVWSRHYPRRIGRRHFSRFNVVARLRRRALSRWDRLCAIHGSTDAALDHLYRDKRGKAAHADRHALEYDGLGTLADQLRDADLLKYAARVAIDRVW